MPSRPTTAPDAYERLVDRLLASPHYGERMALFWLDLVRYADTTGYHSDNHVDIYLFRDYVIRAFNANMPFDRFTVEQLAGDLVPVADRRDEDRLGLQPAAADDAGGGRRRPRSTWPSTRPTGSATPRRVWLGATMGCAECHDHKYDPFTTRDFYRFAAFFADVKETAVGVQEPTRFPTPEQAEALRRLDASRSPLVEALDRSTPELEHDQQALGREVRGAVRPQGPRPRTFPGRSSISCDRSARAERRAEEAPGRPLPDHRPRLEPVRKAITQIQKQRRGDRQACPDEPGGDLAAAPGDAGPAPRQLAGRIRARGHARRAGLPRRRSGSKGAEPRGSTSPGGWSRPRIRWSPGSS